MSPALTVPFFNTLAITTTIAVDNGATAVIGGSISPKDPTKVIYFFVTARLVGKGVWLRPFGKLVYAMPPYIISRADLDHLTRSMVEAVREEGAAHGR